MNKIQILLVLAILALITACDTLKGQERERKESPARQGRAKVPEAQLRQALDFNQIEQIVGIKGTAQDGEYKITVPQNELAVSVDGFRIVPPMGLTSWAAFTPAPQGTMVMGDLVIQEDEIGPVEQALIVAGLTITGLHNHFVRDVPKVMFMHIHGMGTVEAMARGVRTALDKVKDLRNAKGLKPESFSVKTTFDPSKIDAILGYSGKMNENVYKVTVGRPDVSLIDDCVPISTFMGFNTWMAFQGTVEKAAVAGDFAMLADEVGPVIQALVTHNIEVVAVHNHLTTEQPRIFFLHFWGVESVEVLARGLKAGLHQSGSKQQKSWTFDSVEIGTLPEGWKVEATNPKGKLAEWSVQKDASAPSESHVLALTKTNDSHGSTFNLCWTDLVNFKDGTIEVKVKAGKGREDQGGGPIWRVQDGNNYYIARWNPLEDNFRLYYVKNGNRHQLATAQAKLPANQWHTITIHHQGTHIEGSLDGKKLLEADDATFLEAGGVGVWTKADAATFFDAIHVREQ